MSKNPVIKDVTANLAASVVVAASAFVISVFCARFYGAEAFGAYSYAVSAATPIFILFGLNFRQLISSYPSLTKSMEQGFHHVQILGLGAAFLLSQGLSIYSPLHRFDTVLSLVAFAKLADVAADGRYGWLARNGRFDIIARRRIIRAITTLAAFLLVSWQTNSLLWAIGAWAFCSTLLLLYDERASLRNAKYPKIGISWAALRVAFISGLAASLDSLAGNIPRIAIGLLGSLRELAHVAAVMQIPVLFALVVGAIGNAMIPRWRMTPARRVLLKEFLLAQLCVLLLSFGLFCTALLWGDGLIELLYGADFEDLGWMLSSVSLGSAFWFASGINGCALQSRGFYTWQLYANGAALVTSLAVVILALSSDGAVSGAEAIAAYVCGMAGRLLVSTLAVVRCA